MNLFDRIAAAVSKQVAHAWFFCLCVLLVIVWAPTKLLGLSTDTWQLVINTITTIVTFLLVALLQNDQQQFANAINHKLDTQSRVLAQLARQFVNSPTDIQQLQDSVGSEKKIGAS